MNCGRIVLADTDWGSSSVDFDDVQLERDLMSFFARRLRPNGFAGRQFYRLCHQAGLEEINVDVFPLIQLDYTQTPFGQWLATEAEKNDIASRQQLIDWQGRLSTLNDEGRFFACVNFIIVSATKSFKVG